MKRLLIMMVLAILCTGCASTKTELAPEPELEEKPLVECTDEELKTRVPGATLEGEPRYVFSEYDKWLMSQVLFQEAGATNMRLQLYCASVMLNQLDAPYYGDTIQKVLKRKNAYEGYDKFVTNGPAPYTGTCELVVDYVCHYGSVLPDYIWFFRTNELFPWKGVELYCVVKDLHSEVWFQYFPEPLRRSGSH